MPGGNCCLPQCTVSVNKKHQGKSLFQIPARKNEFYTNWRNNLINIVRKYRVIDQKFIENAAAGKVHICEDHFMEEDIVLTSKCLYYFIYIIKMLPFVDKLLLFSTTKIVYLLDKWHDLCENLKTLFCFQLWIYEGHFSMCALVSTQVFPYFYWLFIFFRKRKENSAR